MPQVSSLCLFAILSGVLACGGGAAAAENGDVARINELLEQSEQEILDDAFSKAPSSAFVTARKKTESVVAQMDRDAVEKIAWANASAETLSAEEAWSNAEKKVEGALGRTTTGKHAGDLAVTIERVASSIERKKPGAKSCGDLAKDARGSCVAAAILIEVKRLSKVPAVESDELDVATFLSEFGKRRCASLAVCCSDTKSPLPVSGCEELVHTATQELITLVDEGALTFVPEEAMACLVAIPEAECSESISFGLDLDLCKPFTGLSDKEAGESCTTNFDCAVPENGTASCDLGEDDTGMGTCHQELRGKAGDACSSSCREDFASIYSCSGTTAGPVSPFTESECWLEDGLYCSEVSGTCAAIKHSGDSCTDFAECDSELCSDGVCKATAASGTTCTSDEECESGVCTEGRCAGQWESVCETFSGL